MPVYKDTEELQNIMMELWQRIGADPSMCKQLLASKLCVQFSYREPEGRITVDCTDGKEMRIHAGPCAIKPIVEMSMKADVAHEFWLGKVNVPVAILTGRMMAKGPVSKALALLPVIKPAYQIYPEIKAKATAQACASKN